MQSHLARVYATLVVGVILSALGVCVQFVTQMGGFVTHIATFGMLMWLMMDKDAGNVPKASVRRICFFTSGLLTLPAAPGQVLRILCAGRHFYGQFGCDGHASGPSYPTHCLPWNHRCVRLLLRRRPAMYALLQPLHVTEM